MCTVYVQKKTRPLSTRSYRRYRRGAVTPSIVEKAPPSHYDQKSASKWWKFTPFFFQVFKKKKRLQNEKNGPSRRTFVFASSKKDAHPCVIVASPNVPALSRGRSRVLKKTVRISVTLSGTYSYIFDLLKSQKTSSFAKLLEPQRTCKFEW